MLFMGPETECITGVGLGRIHSLGVLCVRMRSREEMKLCPWELVDALVDHCHRVIDDFDEETVRNMAAEKLFDEVVDVCEDQKELEELLKNSDFSS
jgi:hypothetical protein